MFFGGLNGDGFFGEDEYGSPDLSSFRNQRRKHRKRKTDISGDWWSHKMARKLLEDLVDLKPYVFSVGSSYKGGNPSVYIKFSDEKFRSVRIGDHPGYSKYSYKWNLRSDMNGSSRELDGKVNRFYHSDIGELCNHLQNYAAKVVY